MTYGSKKWREWVLDEKESRPFIQRALETGINFFDTADMYSAGASEEVLGRALKDFGPSRDRLVIATKVFKRHGRRSQSARSFAQAYPSRHRRQPAPSPDRLRRSLPDSPFRSAHADGGDARALNEVVRAGKALYIGASSMFAWQFAQMLAISDGNGWARFITMQNHYNLLYREEEREMNPLCCAEGVGLIPWSPLARAFSPAVARRKQPGRKR